MKFSQSRRMFLVGVGGGLASASLVWALWGAESEVVTDVNPIPACCAYADYDGWLVTTADKAQLISTADVRMLEAVSLEGGSVADRRLPDVASCAAWCVSNTECQSFSYAKASHPDDELRGRCWIKNSSELKHVTDPQFVSGIRWQPSEAGR